MVQRITYQNPENGYSVLKVAVKGQRELVPLVGNLLDVNVGSVLNVEGEWKIDGRYGRQFVAESWEETLPATVFGMEKYLGSGLIKGVGPRFAKRIVEAFGMETLSVIDREPERLYTVSGIGKNRVAQIIESWEKQKEIKNIMLFLQEHGVSTALGPRIFQQYGNESVQIMRDNPFRLADEIWGIGFRTADIIGVKLGVDKNAFLRLRSGILYTLGALADEGHVFADLPSLLAKGMELLGADEHTLVMTLDEMLRTGDVIKEGEAIYLPPFFYGEIGVSGKLARIMRASGKDRLFFSLRETREKTKAPSVSVDVEAIERRLQIRYDQVQKEAIRLAAGQKVMILTGGPGTGKTTTIRGIIEAFRNYGLRILLAAPTGRAARRLSETTGLEAKTIHRLLEYKPPEGYQKTEENPLSGDALILDECSMVDLLLMNALLKAMPDHMRLIMVGDRDQLPSVGAGNVLGDLLDAGCVPKVCLKKIFRQARTSRIILNAHRINQGQMPDLSNGKASDFFFIEREEPQEALAEVLSLVGKKLPGYYGISPFSIQVLSPMQRGETGTINLNLRLQSILNPRGEGLRQRGYHFLPGDKVMQIKNNYDKEVFNGDIGTIEEVDALNQILTVSFDGQRILYEKIQLDELIHAYAVTIHKSQGSEYPFVVLPLLMHHYSMLERNLIYTAITRAKRVLVLVGSKRALSHAIASQRQGERNSLLRKRLEERFAR